MFYKQEFGIDLGTDTIKIYDKREDSVITEKNLIAIRGDSELIAVGNDAFEMVNRASADIVVTTPSEAGKISDIRMTEAIIHSLLFKQRHYIGRRPDIYFAVPADMTEIEKRAYASIAKRGKLRNCSVYLVEKPIADALALGIPVAKAKGTTMLNIGASGTVLSAIAESNVILNNFIPIGGNTIDIEIAAAVRKKNNIIISRKMAQKIKTDLIDGDKPSNGAIAEGIDTDSGLPRSGFITSGTVNKVVDNVIDELIVHLQDFMQRIPPQIRSITSEEGIYLTGGCSRIRDIRKKLSEGLGYPVHLSSLYEQSTINGLKEVISYAGANRLAYAPMQRK